MMDLLNGIMQLFGRGIPCVFQLLTGLYCPGCGGTRSASFLLRGQLLKSLQYHPLVGYMAVVVTLEAVSWVLSKLRRNPKLHLGRYHLFVWIGVGITVSNFVWKNYMLLVQGIDLLP